jgi:hypothetical protein
MPAGHTCLDIAPGDVMADLYGLGAAAMRYLAWGYAVIPLARGEKYPHKMLPVSYEVGAQNGIYHATNHHQQVAEWWSGDKAANIGVATGQRSHLLVIDLDVKRGVNGPANFANFGGNDMPEGVPYARTPSNGWHLWLRTPEGESVPERPSFLPGVDIKGDGGLVVAAPSMAMVHPKLNPGEHADAYPVSYRWEAGCPCSVPMAPPWLLGWAQEGPTMSGSDSLGPKADLEALARDGIPVGQRNQTLYRLACGRWRVHGTGTDGWSKVWHDLEKILVNTIRHDFSQGEVHTIMHSARRFVTAMSQAEEVQLSGWERARAVVR